MDIEKIATGEHWYGTRALDLGLADEIRTSDELLSELVAERDLYSVSYKIKQPLQKRLLGGIDSALEKADAAGWRHKFESRLPR
jgi:serine protease SohB